jgi:hypothetical protein
MIETVGQLIEELEKFDPSQLVGTLSFPGLYREPITKVMTFTRCDRRPFVCIVHDSISSDEPLHMGFGGG